MMFAYKVNPTTGKMEWIVSERDYNCIETDVSEEFSRSHYGDMLHDKERNIKYYQGLHWAINCLRSKGVEPKVLDIGTGTGLLAMMAAKCGAQYITACEVFKPMVKISLEAIEANGYKDIIKVIPKRSTELTVGQGCDMPERANILVSEVFDSELIGEGAVPTFTHALENLLEKDAIVIPSEAHIYIQLFQSQFLYHSQTLDTSQLHCGPQYLTVPSSWKRCPGPASLWDIHLEEVMIPEQLVLLSEPLLVGKLSFDDLSRLPKSKVFPPIAATPTRCGSAHGVAMWWTITMAPGVEISTSPWQQNRQWRDHWLPCVQLYSEPVELKEGVPIQIQLISDEYTLWTSLIDSGQGEDRSLLSRPVCGCGVHLGWSRNRLRMTNDTRRNKILMESLRKILPNKSNVLTVSDGSMLPVMCLSTGIPNKIFAVESNPHSARSINEFCSTNLLLDRIKILTKSPIELTVEDFSGHTIDVLVAEPFFITTTLPWHNLFYWYIRTSLAAALSTDAIIMPSTAYLKAIAVKFENLHYVKASVGNVEGFDVSAYDRAVAKCYKDSPPNKALPPEDYSLWEYPCYPLSGVQTLMKFDFTSPVPADEVLENEGSWPLTKTTECHGIVLWMEYQLLKDMNHSSILSDGLLVYPEESYSNNKLIWSTSHNQGVCFFVDETNERNTISYKVRFDTKSGEMDFTFM